MYKLIVINFILLKNGAYFKIAAKIAPNLDFFFPSWFAGSLVWAELVWQRLQIKMDSS